MATATAYEDALEFLFPRVTTIKFGLDTTRTLLAAVGNPHEMIPSIHVGGTNGKGSVASLIASALDEMGWKVGLYTSPHVVSFRERMRVAGVPISEEAVAMWTAKLRPLIEEHGGTFFEATTAMAFADFAARGVEIAVVEVGLGGRLDSTNVVRPLVSVVTKIEMDHVKYLGDTLELIAGTPYRFRIIYISSDDVYMTTLRGPAGLPLARSFALDAWETPNIPLRPVQYPTGPGHTRDIAVTFDTPGDYALVAQRTTGGATTTAPIRVRPK